MSMFTWKIKVFAALKREKGDSYRLEVICTTCKRRGVLWFEPEYRIEAHSCPNCSKRTLQTPVWLGKYKPGTFKLFLK